MEVLVKGVSALSASISFFLLLLVYPFALIVKVLFGIQQQEPSTAHTQA